MSKMRRQEESRVQVYLKMSHFRKSRQMFQKMIKESNPKLVTDEIHAHELINKYHLCFSFYWVR